MATNQRIERQLLTVMDVMPTILDLADIAPPGERFKDRDVLPMRGKSFAPLLTDQGYTVHEADEEIALASIGRNVMFRGPWKIVREPGQQWELFNLEDDPSESTDLSSRQPELKAELVAAFERYAEERNYIDRVPMENEEL